MTPPRVLIVAGSDSGGGAGIQADIKTVTMLGGFAASAITALTAQNTLGVTGVFPVPAEFVVQQIEAVLSDIGSDAVKIGMIGSAETAEAVADRLSEVASPIIFDPVMVATSGSLLADGATIAAFDRLARAATLVTPNVPELAALTGSAIETEAELQGAALDYARSIGTAVLAKGGHLCGETLIDVLVQPDGTVSRWSSPRIDTRHTHGTGCTLASAIATNLGRGRPLGASIAVAREFVRIAMQAAPGFGAGHGPMGHERAAYGETNLNQVTLPASDYASSVAFYKALGLGQIVDSPDRYARFECPGGATLSIHIEPGLEPGGATICLESPDLDAWVDQLRDKGFAFETLPEDMPWGWRQAYLKDPAGNRVVLYRAGTYRLFPPWRLDCE